MTFVLGLAGADTCGKSSTAIALHNLDGRFALRSWAHSIRYSAAEFLNVDADWFHVDKDQALTSRNAPIPELIGRTKRWFLQQWGTGFGRQKLGPDVWVNMAMRPWAMGSNTHFVFDDTRFPNEAARCDVVIELSRVGVDYPRNHESSHPLPDCYIDWRLELTPGKPEIDAERILNYLRREHGV